MGDTLVVLLIVLIIVLIWRGPKTLPQIGQLLGRGVRAAREEAKSIRGADDSDSDKPSAQ